MSLFSNKVKSDLTFEGLAEALKELKPGTSKYEAIMHLSDSRLKLIDKLIESQDADAKIIVKEELDNLNSDLSDLINS